MDAPVRGYAQVEVDKDGACVSAIAITPKSKPKRERPFAAEYAFMRELGLYDEQGRRIESQK